MKCPYCNNRNFIPQVVFLNAEAYGGGIKHFRCLKCDNVVRADFEVKVSVFAVEKSERKEGDWG